MLKLHWLRLAFGAELVGRHVEQLQHNTLRVGDRVPERLHMMAGVDEAVAALMRKERKDFAGGGRFARSGFGVNRKRFELVSDHGLAKLALEQGVNRDGDEEEKEERIDALGALEVHRDDLGDGLELLVSLLDEGLVLVDFQDISGYPAARGCRAVDW